MKFVSIDVETANADMASICQIGLASYENGVLLHEWKSYVNPEGYFDSFNISIHGIDESLVKNAPNFQALAETLYSFLDGSTVVCHTHFDRVAIHQAAARFGIRTPAATWLDSAKVARRAWKQFAWSGFGLYEVCQELGYVFKHHDALEDAKAAAYILLAAERETGLDVQRWLNRVSQPIAPEASSSAQAIRRDGDPDGPLFGELVAFTGSLAISRREAADLAAAIGCRVVPDVSKKTTVLGALRDSYS